MIDFRTKLTRCNGPGALSANFNKIEFENGFDLSVQAGSGKYSEPNEVLENVNDYTSFEVALFDPFDKWVTILNADRWSSELSELLNELNFEDGDFGVGGWISVEDVQKLHDLIQAIASGLRRPGTPDDAPADQCDRDCSGSGGATYDNRYDRMVMRVVLMAEAKKAATPNVELTKGG
jgi:hypothetical protein